MANKRQKNVQNSVYKDACDISVRMYKKYKKQITVVTYDWVGKQNFDSPFHSYIAFRKFYYF